jgi:hypothetical protein
MVIIVATTAMASTVPLLLYNFDVPSPSGLLSGRGFRPSEGLLGMRHILAGVLEHYILELTADFTANEVDLNRVRLGLWVAFAGHDVDQKGERRVVHLHGQGCKPPPAGRLSHSARLERDVIGEPQTHYSAVDWRAPHAFYAALEIDGAAIWKSA